MRLRVLGCHGPYPCAGGATSGYLIENGDAALLMDCGAGVLGKLTALCDPAALSGVLLSHWHFDHCSDLTVMGYYLEAAGVRLPVYAPGEDCPPVRALLSPRAFEVRDYPAGALEIAGLHVTTAPVRHPVPCRALRLTNGEKTLIYTGDTNDCPGLAAFAADADALLADAAFLDGEWRDALPHMSARGAAVLARDARARRLYLTHLSPRHAPESYEEEAKAVFAAASAVRPGMVIAL